MGTEPQGREEIRRLLAQAVKDHIRRHRRRPSTVRVGTALGQVLFPHGAEAGLVLLQLEPPSYAMLVKVDARLEPTEIAADV